MAATARRRAERNPDADLVLGTLVDLLAYISEPARKAAATRAQHGQPKKKSSRRGQAPPPAAPAAEVLKPAQAAEALKPAPAAEALNPAPAST